MAGVAPPRRSSLATPGGNRSKQRQAVLDRWQAASNGEEMVSPAPGTRKRSVTIAPTPVRPSRSSFNLRRGSTKPDFGESRHNRRHSSFTTEWLFTTQQKTISRASKRVWTEATADVQGLLTQGIGAMGKVYFRSDEELQVEPARFATVNISDADPEMVVKLLLSYWRIEKPSLLLSVTGSAQGLDIEVRLEHLLMDGLNSAARSTRAWVTTGATDSGVMALVGRALQSRNASDQTEQSEASAWRTPLIGIAQLNKITDHEQLAGAVPDEGLDPPMLLYNKSRRNSAESAALDTNHSHFVLIDTSEADNDWYHEVDMRGRIEQRLTDKLALPRVEIVVQGGVGTLLTVLHALKRSVPIVLVRESKGCAKALADFVTKLRTSPITGTAGSAEDLAFWRRQLVDELNCNNCGLDSQWVKLEKDINRLVELLLCERPGSDGIKPPPHATGDDAHETASNTLVQIFTVTDECSPRTAEPKVA